MIPKYRLKGDRTKPPVQAPAPAPTIPGTLCGSSLAAAILIDKSEDHLPHYRQSQRYRRRCGVELSRQTAEDYLEEVIKRLPPDATEAQAAALTPAAIAATRKSDVSEGAA